MVRTDTWSNTRSSERTSSLDLSNIWNMPRIKVDTGWTPKSDEMNPTRNRDAERWFRGLTILACGAGAAFALYEFKYAKIFPSRFTCSVVWIKLHSSLQQAPVSQHIQQHQPQNTLLTVFTHRSMLRFESICVDSMRYQLHAHAWKRNVLIDKLGYACSNGMRISTALFWWKFNP